MEVFKLKNRKNEEQSLRDNGEIQRGLRHTIEREKEEMVFEAMPGTPYSWMDDVNSQASRKMMTLGRMESEAYFEMYREPAQRQSKA